MSPRRGVFGMIAMVTLLGAVTFVALYPRKPQALVVNGKSMEVWSREAYAGRPDALATVTNIGSKAVPNLVWQLRTKDSRLRRTIWRTKSKFPGFIQKAIQATISGPDPKLITGREAAAFCLGAIGPQARTAVPVLRRALSDDEGVVCWKAAAALGMIGSNAVPALAASLKDRDHGVRWRAAYALGEMGSQAEAGIPALIGAVSDSNGYVRDSSIYSLSQVGTAAVLALIDMQQTGNDRNREVARRTLAELDRISPDLVTRAMMGCARDASAETRKRAVTALGAMRAGHPLAKKTLIETLQDPNREVRLAAIDALGGMGKRGRLATSALRGLTDDPDEQVRKASKAALAKIEIVDSGELPQSR